MLLVCVMLWHSVADLVLCSSRVLSGDRNIKSLRYKSPRWFPFSGEPAAGLPTLVTEVAGEACIVTDSGVELVGVHPRELFVVGLAVVDEGPARSFAPVRRRVRRGSEMAGVAGRQVLLPAVPAAVRVRNRPPNSPRGGL